MEGKGVESRTAPGDEIGTDIPPGETPVPLTLQTLRQRLAPYGKPDRRKSVLQILNTVVPYVALWILMISLLRWTDLSWEILPLALLTALLMVRVFVLFHDCAHGSFFAAPWANRLMGYITGILTFTPYESWAHPHNIHHGTYADLDHRGVGDIWTLTRREYSQAPPLRRLAYRLYRSPGVLLGLGPPLLFLIRYRLPIAGEGKVQRRSVWITNLAVGALAVGLIALVGWRDYLLVQLTVVAVASNIGVWLFYVQHQFEGVYWSRHLDWDPMEAALTGSSHYRLPRVLQWITASIGLHHVHHVLPRIPNYNLQRVYDETPILQTAHSLTLAASLRSLRLNLWDEEQRRLVSFREAARQPSAP